MSNSENNLLFGKFEIIETLKKDEFSNVYIANHHYLGKKIILKTLDTINLNDSTVQERFKREAKILAQLDHPNIIKVLDFGTEGSRLYISFEFFESKNLREYLRDTKPDNETKKYLFIQLLKGLDYAHRNNIIHRDIKPENILVNKNNQLKIADFGLAFAANDSSVTRKSSILGTPSYMSPEQITGGEVSYQSDLFAVGIVTYEMYTSVNPFVKGDINSTINFILNYTEDSLQGIKELPEDVRESVSKLLLKSKTKRTKLCSDVLSELKVSEAEFRSVVNEDPNTKKPGAGSKHLRYVIPSILLAFIAIFYFVNLFDYKQNSAGEEKLIKKKIDSTGVIANPGEGITEKKPVPKEELKTSEDIKKDEGKSELPEIVKTEEIVNVDLNINCSPWATVFIDGQKIDITPLNKSMLLKEGSRNISFVHPDYPEYSATIAVKKDGVVSLRVNLEDVFASVGFQVFPWGEVFIDGRSYGETPIKKKVHLSEGSYKVFIKNPDFPDYSEVISVKKGEDFTLRHKFEK